MRLKRLGFLLVALLVLGAPGAWGASPASPHRCVPGERVTIRIEDGSLAELLRYIAGFMGFYGAHCPAWVSLSFVPRSPKEGNKVRLSGRLVESFIEGRHLELETREGRYVILPANPQVAQELEKYLGREVILEGTISRDPNIYMRGPLFRVSAVGP
ncbi:hypothetical protein [Desulfothermobacter acidiphilus]|uniref:hypothetical protein n=1 Tax=Desulfothermobacter acidiphilus TaxID=1938353 RepID=UPI003F88ECFE